MTINTISWLATSGSILGNIGVIRKRLWGMQVWTYATALWIVYSILTQNYPQLIMFSFYECLNLYGWYSWRKQLKDKERRII